MGPLNGLLVVALEQAVAAPLCTVRLADAGARVIKIERPEGDFAREYDSVVHGESSYFVWLNRGKESVVLNLKEPNDQRLLHRLIGRADVFVQNLAPGAASRYGCGSELLRASWPTLITCDISGYGDVGPYRKRKAYDLLIQCETALVDITGGPAEPGRVGVSIADIGCGMSAHAAILQALFEREKTDCGRALSVSLFDTVAEWMTVPLLHFDYGGKAPARVGIRHPSIAPYGAFVTSDGLQTVLAIQNDREWADFCRVVLRKPDWVCHAEFATNIDRCANRPDLDTRIAAALITLTAQELRDRLESAKLAFASLNTVADLSRHPQLKKISLDTPSGAVNIPHPSTMVFHALARSKSTPTLGEDTARIRLEFA